MWDGREELSAPSYTITSGQENAVVLQLWVVWEEATPRRLVAAEHMDTILCMVTAEALE